MGTPDGRRAIPVPDAADNLLVQQGQAALRVGAVFNNLELCQGAHMNRTSLRPALLIAAFSLLGFGCAGTDWQRVQVAPDYQAPKQMKISIVMQAASEHAQEATVAFQQALLSELASRGITATLVAGPADPSSSQMSVVEWNQGVRALRWLGFGGQAHILVMVKSLSGTGQPGVDGQARSWLRGGAFGGDSYNAATEAGRSIAKVIATGKAG
jgi:hypothetical protein